MGRNLELGLSSGVRMEGLKRRWRDIIMLRRKIRRRYNGIMGRRVFGRLRPSIIVIFTRWKGADSVYDERFNNESEPSRKLREMLETIG